MAGDLNLRLQPEEQAQRSGPLASAASRGSEGADEERHRGEDLYRALARDLPNVAVFVFDHDLRVLVAEGEALTRHRLRHTSVVGRLLEEVLPREGYETLAPSWRAALAGGRTEFEYAPRETDRSFWVTTRPLRGETGEVWAGLTLTQDITHLRRTELELRAQTEYLAELAQYDALTSLANRALFRDRLSHALARAARDRRLIALMFIDLDRFKAFNDVLGHDGGDAVLRATAARLKASVREVDTVARLAGDEFAVLLEGIERKEDVMPTFERISAAFEQPLPLAGRDLFVTASIGIALGPEDGATPESLLVAADTAMYRAKARGGNAHRFFSPDMELKRLELLELESALHRALTREEFVLHYQPTVDLRSGDVVSVEALIRWYHPKRGLLPPGEFVSVAERSGLITGMSEWVLQRACAQVRAWRDDGLPEFRVAVNISHRDLRTGMSRLVRRVLAESGLPAGALELEITERDLGEEPAIAETALAEVKELGVRVAIDDFGTGYSSLSRLQDLPVDVLKIDRSFVQSPEHDAATVLSIVALGHSFGLEVLGEGVETPGQYVRLREADCDAAMGFLIAPPLPPEHLRRWLLETHRSGSRAEGHWFRGAAEMEARDRAAEAQEG
jgi:diguanylate cyclase (GGDEF)-like protein